MTQSENELIELARAGVIYREISELTGVSMRRAGEVARRAGIHRKPCGNPSWSHFGDAAKQQACDMYIDGRTLGDITSAIPGHPADNTIRQWLDRAGVKRRDSGRRAVYDGRRIRALRVDGFSTAAIAEIMGGCAHSTVWYHCNAQIEDDDDGT